MAKKLTYEFIKESFENEEYILLSEEYISNRQKLEYVCPKGHKHRIMWVNWNKGKRCPYCSKNGKPKINDIRDSFKKKGYTLISTEYKNNRSKLEYICSEGHRHRVDWSSWKAGHLCTYCANKPVINIGAARASFAKEGYTILSEDYVNEYSLIIYICPNGHKHSIRWNNWQQGNRCPICDNIKKHGAGHPNWKGGISNELYCPVWQDKEYKEDIKSRDGYRCLNPDCFKKDNRLHIHHIDYDKKNCAPNNLITLCGSCNSRANYNRNWHTHWYRAIINKRYGGL